MKEIKVIDERRFKVSRCVLFKGVVFVCSRLVDEKIFIFIFSFLIRYVNCIFLLVELEI